MLSYACRYDLDNNPFELGMERLVDLDMEADFVSKAALRKISKSGVSIRQVGLEFDGPPLAGSNDEPWPITVDGRNVGKVTSAVYSPRLENIALALMNIGQSDIGTTAIIEKAGDPRHCTVVPKPFYDPKKSLATKS